MLDFLLQDRPFQKRPGGYPVAVKMRNEVLTIGFCVVTKQWMV